MSFPLPRYIQLYPTTCCNQDCSFCFNTSAEKGCSMTHGKSLELLDILSGHGIADLDIMGGEPFLLDWMPDFIAAAVKKGMRLNISTNGSRPQVMQRLADRDPASVNVGVSLEGSTAETHNRLTCSAHFDLAIKSIQILVSLGLDPVVKTVLSRRTLAEIEHIIRLIGDLGVRRYYLIHMDVMAKDPSLLHDSLGYADFAECRQKIRETSRHVEVFSVHASCFAREKLPRGTRCAGGVLKLSVMPDGSVYPCNLFHGRKEFRLGTIFDEELAAMWRHPKLALFRTFHENNCRLPDCRNHAACTGGCPAHGYLHYGSTNAPDIRCFTPLNKSAVN
jgi:radical SAM protein with 4Fe4S-binding SPASM domain